MKKLVIGLAAGALAMAGAAWAQQQQTPEQRAQTVATNRAALFKTMGAAFGPAGAMMQGRATFDAAAAGLAAQRIEVLAGMIKPLTATDTSAIVKNTQARTIVWTERADFEKKADDLVKAAAALRTAAATGNEAATKTALQGLGGACKSCHDKYRDQGN